MKFNPDKHRRQSVRLQGYDYSQVGMYFVTIVAQGRECLFGEITHNEMRLNGFGIIVRDEWLRTRELRPNIELDEFVVMPNHFHGIVVVNCRGTLHVPNIDNDAGKGTLQRDHTVEQFGKPTSNSIPTIMRLFKSVTTKRINEARNMSGQPVWQRNYYEHIIRDEESLNRIREYIANNPAQWESDSENPTFEIGDGRGTLHVPSLESSPIIGHVQRAPTKIGC